MCLKTIQAELQPILMQHGVIYLEINSDKQFYIKRNNQSHITEEKRKLAIEKIEFGNDFRAMENELGID